MTTSSLDRLLELLRRDLDGVEVQLVNAPSPEGLEDGACYRSLPAGRFLVVTPRGCKDAVDEVRLDALLDAFADTLEVEPSSLPVRRPPVGRSLRKELQSLTSRARAVDALIIDVSSPVLWCSAVAGPVPEGHRSGTPPRLMRAIEMLSLQLHELATTIEAELTRPTGDRPDDLGAADSPPPDLPEMSQRAVSMLRSRPDLDTRHHGGRQRLAFEETDLGVLARGFADIYLLVLVFDGPFNELLAERAAAQALPRIERLVVALPPLDPEPERPARVVSLKRQRE